jgi:hypothetical protein
MTVPAMIALVTSVVAAVFVVLLARQYLQRRRTHQLLWTASMALYSVSSLIEFLMDVDVLGANVSLFRIYYVAAAALVGLLAAGVVFLLSPKKVARAFLVAVIVLSLGLLATGLFAPIDSTIFNESFVISLVYGLLNASRAYPFYFRIFSILLNVVGSILLIGGVLYSFARDRTRKYNLLIAAGAILPALGGVLLGIFGDPSIFFESGLAGIVLLFLGFVMSARYIAKKEKPMK